MSDTVLQRLDASLKNGSAQDFPASMGSIICMHTSGFQWSRRWLRNDQLFMPIISWLSSRFSKKPAPPQWSPHLSLRRGRGTRRISWVTDSSLLDDAPCDGRIIGWSEPTWNLNQRKNAIRPHREASSMLCVGFAKCGPQYPRGFVKIRINR